MNERILELAKHASKLVRIEHPELSNGITMKEMSKFKVKTFLLTEYDVEKFAELVVLECMRMCEVAQVGYLTHGHTLQGEGCQGAKQYIADWFEVEE